MSEIAKFKLNLKTGEIEVEGTEAFVERQIQALENLVDLMKISVQFNEKKAPLIEEQSGNGDKPASGETAGDTIPSTFGEWMHTFKTELSDADKVLITTRFVQSQSSTNDFKTAEVNKALKEHGFKLSNPSATLNSLVEKKLLFQTRKVGVLKYFRLSVDGQKSLNSLKRQD